MFSIRIHQTVCRLYFFLLFALRKMFEVKEMASKLNLCRKPGAIRELRQTTEVSKSHKNKLPVFAARPEHHSDTPLFWWNLLTSSEFRVCSDVCLHGSTVVRLCHSGRTRKRGHRTAVSHLRSLKKDEQALELWDCSESTAQCLSANDYKYDKLNV